MTGRVAVITGGSQGIGAGLVTGYRGRGWAVVASAPTIEPSEESDLLTVAGDIADPGTADRIADAALDRFGRIDTLINNAGVFVSKPFTDYTAADYALVTGVNLAGFFWLTQRVIADMARRYGGHVVNISATLAEVANSTAPSALAALTKGGLAAATRSLAVEYASRGIRVNAVSPGIIQTPMRPADSYDSLGDRLPPLGRVGQVSDVVDAILFLESSPYITGEILHVDGGQTAADRGDGAGCPRGIAGSAGQADALDQVLPASAEAFGDLRSGLGQDGGGQVEQQRAVQGRGELGGQDVQVGGAEVHLPEQEPDVFPRHGRLRSGWYPLPAVQCGARDLAVPDQEAGPGAAVGDQAVQRRGAGAKRRGSDENLFLEVPLVVV